MPETFHHKLALLPEVLDYNPQTGVLTWKTTDSVPEEKQGQPVRCYPADGCLVFKHLRRTWAVHRVAWLLYYNQWPPGQIRHLNGDNTDNRLANLAAATESNRHVKSGRQTVTATTTTEQEAAAAAERRRAARSTSTPGW